MLKKVNKIKGLLSIILYLFLRIGSNRGIKRTYQSQQLQTHNLPNQKIKEPYKLKTYSYNRYYHYVSSYHLSFNYLSNLFKLPNAVFILSNNSFIKFIYLIPYLLFIYSEIKKMKIKYIIFEGASWTGFIYISYLLHHLHYF